MNVARGLSMFGRFVTLLISLLHAGCGQRPSPQASDRQEVPKQPPQVEVKIGGPDADLPHELPFTVTALYEKQQVTKDAPFHAAGGEWTFFDCQAGTDAKAVFAVGVSVTSKDGGGPSAWGRAILFVKDRDAGGKFVELFSKAFPGTVPKPFAHQKELKPLFLNTAILGQNMSREVNGGFAGQGGGWTATKWFPEHDGRSAEIYFNYNLDTKQGEFSEKDPDYADDLLAIFASALRDGPRPERTPENDHNLTRVGPKIGRFRKLLPKQSAHYSFSPRGHFTVYQDGATIFALPMNVPDGKAFEVIRFDYSPWAVDVLNGDLDLLVQEGVQETVGVKSSSDPMRIWWVDGKSRAKTSLRGPEKGLTLSEEPVSPDLRYVVLSQWQGDIRGGDRTQVLSILDRNSGKTSECKLKGKSLSAIGWKKTDAGLRAMAVTNRWQFDKKESSESYLADPSTGKLEHQANVDYRLGRDNPRSPDGKQMVQVVENELVVTNLQSSEQRRFTFHEDDHRLVGPQCVEWVSPRYLRFNGQRLAFIDTTTMKMCFAVSADGVNFNSPSYRFDPDFRWVLYQGEGIDGEGLFLGRVEMPMEQ